MVEQNYKALHGIVGLLLRAALHRDKICPGELEPRATAQGSGGKRLRSVPYTHRGGCTVIPQAGRTAGAAASERRRLSAPTWRMEICDPGMQRSPRSLPLPTAPRAARWDA